MRYILCLIVAVLSSSALAQTSEKNAFWVFWEREFGGGALCADGSNDCRQSVFFGHYIDGMDTRQSQQFFSGLGSFASTPSNANIRLPESPICLGSQPASLPDPRTLDLSERVDTLRGLRGVHVDLRGVRGPQSFRGSFGEEAHEFALRVMAEHGIPVLTKEQALATPGNAVLKMRYSAEVLGCRPWSVSLSLSQRLFLARAPEIMIESTTWSASARQNEEDIEFGAGQAVEQVVIAFAHAWSEVNNPNWVAPEETN